MFLPSRHKLLYFCDETSHVGDKFMAVGGIAVNLASAREIESKIIKMREKLSLTGEIKWANTKSRRDSGQKAYADLLFELVKSRNIHFHIRFQPMAVYDHKKSGERRKIDTVSKAYYQLISHRPIRYYGDQCDLHIRPDKGECTERLHQYTGAMNSDAVKIHGIPGPCVKSIHQRDSKKSHHLQLLDVTLGALAALRNERHLREGAAKAKRELAEYVHRLWGKVDLTKSSPISYRPFNVWNVRPKWGKRGP